MFPAAARDCYGVYRGVISASCGVYCQHERKRGECLTRRCYIFLLEHLTDLEELLETSSVYAFEESSCSVTRIPSGNQRVANVG